MGTTLAFKTPEQTEAEVTVDGDLVTIEYLAERDTDLAGYVGGATDPADAARQCLRIGARAARVVGVTVDSDIVERRFEDMESRFDERLGLTVEAIKVASDELLGEDEGALTASLEAHKSSLETLLGETFDPSSKKSVLAAFETVMKEAHEQQRDSVRRLLSTDGEDSPLATLRRELVHEMKEQVSGIRKDMQDLSEQVTVDQKVAEVVEITTAKGFTFEAVLEDRLTELAAPHGDLAESTGTEIGNAATKKGDAVVTLSRDDTGGAESRIAFEAKTTKLSMRKTMAELDAAMANRDAEVAVAVFSHQDHAPTRVPFHYSENRAIVVLDAEGTDASALQLAYMWARYMVRRNLQTDTADELDTERIRRLIEDAGRAIDRTKTIAGCHTKAIKAIEMAKDEVADLKDEARSALRLLEIELNGSDDQP